MAYLSDTQVAALAKTNPKSGELLKTAVQLGMNTTESEERLAKRVEEYNSKNTSQAGAIAKSDQQSVKK